MRAYTKALPRLRWLEAATQVFVEFSFEQGGEFHSLLQEVKEVQRRVHRFRIL